MTDTLRIEMRGTDIGVSLIEPGPITSDFRINSARNFARWIDWESSSQPERYAPYRRRLDAPRRKDPFELPSEAVAKTVERALNSRRPKPRYRVTVPAHAIYALNRILPTRALDWIIAKV